MIDRGVIDGCEIDVGRRFGNTPEAVADRVGEGNDTGLILGRCKPVISTTDIDQRTRIRTDIADRQTVIIAIGCACQQFGRGNDSDVVLCTGQFNRPAHIRCVVCQNRIRDSTVREGEVLDAGNRIDAVRADRVSQNQFAVIGLGETVIIHRTAEDGSIDAGSTGQAVVSGAAGDSIVAAAGIYDVITAKAGDDVVSVIPVNRIRNIGIDVTEAIRCQVIESGIANACDIAAAEIEQHVVAGLVHRTLSLSESETVDFRQINEFAGGVEIHDGIKPAVSGDGECIVATATGEGLITFLAEQTVVPGSALDFFDTVTNGDEVVGIIAGDLAWNGDWREHHTIDVTLTGTGLRGVPENREMAIGNL